MKDKNGATQRRKPKEKINQKNQRNQVKHGINFKEAQLLWSYPRRVEIQASSTTEPRFMVIGQVGKKHWSAIIAYRENNIRLISVRRSRDDEVKFYES